LSVGWGVDLPLIASLWNECDMDILIVAIDHELQLTREMEDSPQLASKKDKLIAILKNEIRERGIQFISEEADPKRKTIANTLAQEAEPPIPWKNIMMTDEERSAAGIKEALDSRPGHPDHETMAFWIEVRIPEDLVRENFFIEQTVEVATGSESILMLLGDAHVDAVAEKLTKMGHRVETNHDLIPVRRWEEMRSASGH